MTSKKKKKKGKNACVLQAKYLQDLQPTNCMPNVGLVFYPSVNILCSMWHGMHVHLLHGLTFFSFFGGIIRPRLSVLQLIIEEGPIVVSIKIIVLLPDILKLILLP